MRKLFLMVFAICLSVSAFAMNEANKIYFAIEGGTYSYREPHMDTPMHISANKIGASLEWVGRSILEQSGLMDEEDKSFATFELRYIDGKADYDGFTWGGDPVQDSGEIDWYAEGRITFGETYNLGKNFELWPYLGLGYRYLVNDGSNVSSGSYKRISQYWYMPIGAKIRKDFNKGFVLTLTCEFDWLLAGEQATDLGYLNPAWETDYLYNFQPEGWGIRFGLKAEADVSKKIGVFFEPYYRMWKIQNSNFATTEKHSSGSVTYWYEDIPIIEPFNVTKEAGVRAGIYF